MNKKRILFVNDRMVAGGTEKLLIDLIKGIDKSRFEVSLATLSEGKWDYMVDEFLCEHIILGKEFDGNGEVQYRRLFRIFPKKFFDCQDREYDLIIMYKQVYYFLLPLFKAAKTVMFIHEDYANGSSIYEGQNPIKLAVFGTHKRLLIKKRVDKFIGVTDQVAESYKKYFKLKEVGVINNGINFIEVIEKSKENKNFLWEQGCRYLTTISMLNVAKNTITILRAFDELAKKHTDIRLIIGGAGGQRQVMEDYVAEHGLTNKVIFIGATDNPYYYMAKSKIFVSGSYLEAFGLTTVESMSLGVPVVSVDNVGVRNIIQEGKGGSIVKNDIDSMVSELDKYLSDEQYYHSKASKSKLAVKKFDIGIMIDNVEKLIDDLIDNK